MKKNINNIAKEQLFEIFKGLGLKPYAHKQVFQWLFKMGVETFDEMTNLSKESRKVLEDNFYIGHLKNLDLLEGQDGTKKFLFELEDAERIEAVLIAMESDRNTLCVSSQVGCALGCQFCRTAGMGFRRNLSQAEIVDQVLEVRRQLENVDEKITNIVFMGMGEPLNNYENVKRAIEILADEDGIFFGRRRITISTAGVVPGIKEMVKDKLGVKLAVSLNATTDEVRRRIMPLAKKFSIEEIIEVCRQYAPPGTRWRTTFEYVMIDGVNDSLDDAKRLVAIMSRLPSKINLIPYNPFPGSKLEKPKEKVLKDFYNYLYNKGIQVNVRKSKGVDILAACGQLAANPAVPAPNLPIE
jgi:23S rRNA (adenine2503-C2)-methyltransferase